MAASLSSYVGGVNGMRSDGFRLDDRCRGVDDRNWMGGEHGIEWVSAASCSAATTTLNH